MRIPNQLPSPSPFQFLNPESKAPIYIFIIEKKNKVVSGFFFFHAHFVKKRCEHNSVIVHLESFAVHEGRTVVFLLAEPGGHSGTAYPHGVLAFGENGVDLHCTRSQISDLYAGVIGAWVHGGTYRQHCVSIDVFADIDTTLDDRIEDKFMGTIIVHTQKGRLEERLGAAELVLAHSDDLAVGHNSSPG